MLVSMLSPGVPDSFRPPDPDSGVKERLGLMAAPEQLPGMTLDIDKNR